MKLKASEEFIKGKHNIGWIGSDFTKNFKNVEFDIHSTPTFQKPGKPMSDAQIESELKPGLCELGDVLAFIKNAPEQTKDGYSNLFYFPAFVVSVGWRAHDSGWRVGTWGRDGSGWREDYRVFSPATGISVTLPSSDTLDLDRLSKMKQLSMSIQNSQDEKVREHVLGYLLGMIDGMS